MIFTYLLAWFGLMIIGILNGVLRVISYQKFMPEIRAHQLSTLTGIIFLGIGMKFINYQWPFQSENTALAVGLIWAAMTLLFEFGFGHFVMRNSWDKLLYDYRIDKGRLWSLVLIWILFGPYLFYIYTQ